MSLKRRLSMNTSLKNAKIFDPDDDNDNNINSKDKCMKYIDAFNDNAQFNSFSDIKQECNSDSGDSLSDFPPPPPSIRMKLEPFDPDDINFNISEEQMQQISVKTEFDENTNGSTNSSKLGKSERGTIFKREAPYDKPEQEPQSSSMSNGKTSPKKRKREFERDDAILLRRQKQINYGKNTIGYDNYVKSVSRNERKHDDPVTPNKYIKYSRRAWDGLIKQWRLKLHKYDP
ncbi:hypothetical protein RI129_004973 [Pyrocoelia pectoralis]|uniref:Histone RNA hairpin-binding protein RNA-binding domain-containing protein n=1 Tax=Pyrocoelia pectoralis TaxID=417401 RepID=A0AAN7VHJ0_9COLE